jgi:predicted secreted protein
MTKLAMEVILTYAVCWWLALLFVLPLSTAPDVEPIKGNVPSAPANPKLRWKAKLATLIACVPTLITYLAIR